jgi:hypothetical protein
MSPAAIPARPGPHEPPGQRPTHKSVWCGLNRVRSPRGVGPKNKYTTNSPLAWLNVATDVGTATMSFSSPLMLKVGKGRAWWTGAGRGVRDTKGATRAASLANSLHTRTGPCGRRPPSPSPCPPPPPVAFLTSSSVRQRGRRQRPPSIPCPGPASCRTSRSRPPGARPASSARPGSGRPTRWRGRPGIKLACKFRRRRSRRSENHLGYPTRSTNQFAAHNQSIPKHKYR